MNNNGNPDMTFSELFEKWYEERSRNIGEVTRRIYRSYFDKYIPDSIAGCPVNDIEYDKWLEMEKAMLGGKAPNGVDVPKTTARQALTVFHAAFKYGKERFGLNNPIKEEQISSKDMYTVTVFTKSEIEKMRKAVKPFDIYHLGIMLCLYTGIEVGEICAVKWKDIDTESKLLKIRMVASGAQKSDFKVSVPKNKNIIRDLPIPTWIAEQLEVMKPMHNDEEYILAGQDGNAYLGTFRSQYAAFLRSAGVEKRIINALRHTFAMNCIEKNVAVKTLSEMLGHSSTSVTIRMYYGVQKNDKREIIENLYV